MSPNDVWITLKNSYSNDFQKTVIKLKWNNSFAKQSMFQYASQDKVWNYTCMDIDFDKMEWMDGSKHTEQVKRTISINLLGNLSLLDF